MDDKLDYELITFGKYKDCTLDRVLRDRGYCKWLLDQEWFKSNYEYLYNRVLEYDPKIYFIKPYDGEETGFLYTYKYFNLTPTEEVKLPLTDTEKKCYEFYLSMIQELKNKVIERVSTFKPNEYDIKAPVNWLKKFEKDYELSRDMFKEFISAYELPNIPYILQDIKKEGGLEYKGADAFNIAKERSVKQEAWWEDKLKSKYGESIGTQFKCENCIFDFLRIDSNTIYECKLGIKDFNEEQYKKYRFTLNRYSILYLIACDGIINIERRTIYTTNPGKYLLYLEKLKTAKRKSKFDRLIEDFEISQINEEQITEYI